MRPKTAVKANNQPYIDTGSLTFRQDRQIISIYQQDELIGVLAMNKPIEAKDGLLSLAWIVSQMMDAGSEVKP